MELEYIAEVLPDGHLSLDPSIARELKTGQKVRIKLEELDQDSEKPSSSLSPEARDFLSYLRSSTGRGEYRETSITRDFIHDQDR